jgi:hypothetical protein
VKSYIAPPITLDYFHAAFGQLPGRGDHIRGPGIASEGDDGKVLENQKNVADAIFFTQLD